MEGIQIFKIFMNKKIIHLIKQAKELTRVSEIDQTGTQPPSFG